MLQALSKGLKEKGGPSVTHVFHLAFQGKNPAYSFHRRIHQEQPLELQYSQAHS